MKKITYNYSYIYFCLIILTLILISSDSILSTLPIYHRYKLQDLKYIFEYGDCLNQIKISNCKEYIDFPFVYPKIWIFISRIANIYQAQIVYLFLLFGYLYISLHSFENLKKKYYFHFFFFFSPASLLLITRANNDLLIFFLIYLAVIFLIRNKFKYRVISFSLFIISFLLKIYSLFLIIIYYINKKNFDKKNLLFFFIFLFFFYLFSSEILEINKIYNKSKFLAAFRSDLIFDLFNYAYPKIQINTKLLSMILLLCIMIGSFLYKNKLNIQTSKKNSLLFISGSIILSTSFFFSNTFDYKLIFILFVIPALIEIKNKKKTSLINFILIIIYLVIWFEFFIFYYSEYINYGTNKLIYVNENNHKIYILGFLLFLKNIFQWMLNIFLIFISKNIIFNGFSK